MRFALSTNWNNRRLTDGAAIVDEALALGFDALELGFNTTSEQLDGFKRSLGRLPVDSVHAYCPVPLSAPSGHPELYQLCADDEDTRALARLHLRRTFNCAAEMGAGTVVFHAAYVDAHSFWARLRGGHRIVTPTKGERARRTKRGRAMIDRFKAAFDPLAPELEKLGLVLALENLPRFEGFPSTDEAETLMKEMAGAPLGLWFDTGHARVRECQGWDVALVEAARRLAPWVRGIHLNDVEDVNDDHFAPGDGKVDFASIVELARRPGVLHVIESSSSVPREALAAGLARMRESWGN